MFVRNDTEEKKYFNGKIGVVKSIHEEEDDEFLEVEFPEEQSVIRVQKVTWQNIRYSFNDERNKIDEEELGSFTQYPVRLAWAVTIHKSQGLTFENVVIDAGAAFAPGQVYVALSRCVSLEGIVLLSRIPAHVIMTDETIVEFSQQQNSVEALLPLLEKEKENFFIRKALALFDLQAPLDEMQKLIAYMGERRMEGKEKIISALHVIHDSIIKLKETSEKFQEQIRKMAAEGLNESIQEQLQDRITKGKAYFEKELDEKVNDQLEQLNKEIQELNKVRKLLKEMKSFMDYFGNFTNRFRTNPKRREEEIYSVPVSSEGSPQVSGEYWTALFDRLKQIRWQLSKEENVAPFMICHDSTLKEIATYLPQSLSDLALIKGMGDKKLTQYGESFLEAVGDFCRANGLPSQMHLRAADLKQPKTKKKTSAEEGDTKTRSFNLFKSGKTVEEIAAMRGMAVSTIEGHLAHFVQNGKLDLNRLVPDEKFELIQSTLTALNAPGLSPVKQALGDRVSYSEIRLVAAFLSHTKSEEN
jgi:hypothetical protein